MEGAGTQVFDRLEWPERERAGRYELFAEIGSGAMASVHVGRLLSAAGFARTVAIKRPLPGLSREMEFRRVAANEARLASRVHHPNVVATLDVIERGSELLVVMEYLRAETLAALTALARAGRERIPVSIATACVVGVLRGLQAVHDARDERGRALGLIHRDVSPQNVLCGTDGVVRVGDFGLAHAANMGSAGDREFRGKLSYASPEQLEVRTLTPASDLYAVGIILWELVVGERIYESSDAARIVTRLLHQPAPSARERAPSVPAWIDAIVRRALERDPARRFASALAMAAAVEAGGELASNDEIAAWVSRLAADSLAKRDQLVAVAESETSPSRRARELIEHTGAASRRELVRSAPEIRAVGAPIGTGKGIALRAAGALTGVCIAFSAGRVILAPRDPSAPVIAHVPTATATGETTAVPPSSEIAAMPPAAESAPPFSFANNAAAPASRRHPPPPPHRREGRALSSDDCLPPFSLDSEGIRHMKAGCR